MKCLQRNPDFRSGMAGHAMLHYFQAKHGKRCNMKTVAFGNIGVGELALFCTANVQHYTFSEACLTSEIYGDPWIEDELVLAVRKNDGSLAGILVGVVRPWTEPVCATIQLFVVDRTEQGSGLASEMYAEFESRAIKKGVTVIEMLGGGVYYLLTGLDPRHERAYRFFLSRGFERGHDDRVNMICDLTNLDIDTVPLHNLMGITVRRAEKVDRPAVKQFNLREFGQGWAEEVDRGFSNRPISVYVATDTNGDIVAFSAYCAGYNRFGPMATQREHRGKGIGRICLFKCLQGMRDEFGMTHATIPWVGPTDFYRHVCASTIERTYWMISKHL